VIRDNRLTLPLGVNKIHTLEREDGRSDFWKNSTNTKDLSKVSAPIAANGLVTP
jgi:hypothetical protein